ncbi:Tripartite tricarboxylate transporter TctB family protein [Cohaesibacter sp. ES.047]|uniref:tripartite tricarboxylate transporter TctB family protein n=1 Tax=Cohaesibacter sp. ES.047 TaxID=1798205 RepID=UPI000BB7D402|nr:tripartite tricarboxylate transporter TctB family protein [Cohaesibacter sp. ES.047]SNY93375.1 Tripartite tricarboxylate transporter TctB family protein [Cohaesibacter sp. ES.047]
MNYKIAEISVSVVFLIASFVFWFSIKDIPADAQMFPNFILGGIAVCSVLMIIRSITGASQKALGEELNGWTFAISWKRVLGGFFIFVAYLLVVDHIGYFTASALMVIVMARFAGFKNWVALIGSAAGFCVFVYLVFSVLFDRPLPQELIVALFTSSN